MGSTGHSVFQKSRTGNANKWTFNIPGAVNFKGKLPRGSGMEKPGTNKITLKVPNGKDSMLFQFRLSKDNSVLHIYGYQGGENSFTSRVDVNPANPSLDYVMRVGKSYEQKNAYKLRRMMDKIDGFNEESLYQIARKLKKIKGE